VFDSSLPDDREKTKSRVVPNRRPPSKCASRSLWFANAFRPIELGRRRRRRVRRSRNVGSAKVLAPNALDGLAVTAARKKTKKDSGAADKRLADGEAFNVSPIVPFGARLRFRYPFSPHVSPNNINAQTSSNRFSAK